MAYIRDIILLFFALASTPAETAEYGKSCLLLFSNCDYEGGACDITTSKCGCADETQVYSKKTGKCQIEASLGAACSVTDNCTNDGAVCTNNKCTCGDGFYDTRFPWLHLPEGQCLPNAEIGEKCVSSSGCADESAVCVNGICTCSTGYNVDNKACLHDTEGSIPTDVKIMPLEKDPMSLLISWTPPTSGLTGPITDTEGSIPTDVKIMPLEKDPMSLLISWTPPTSGLTGPITGSVVTYKTETTNSTVEAVLGDQSSIVIKDLEEDTYIFTVTTRTLEKFTLPSVQHIFTVTGEGCQVPLCHDLEGHCCCLPLYYSYENSCKSVNETAVVGLKTYSTMTSLNVSWSPPAAANTVSCYEVRLFPYINKTLQTNAGDADNRTVLSDDFNGVVEFNGLVPGRPYDVQVASKRNCEESTELFVVNIIAITNPGIPGPISDQSELDPGDAEITVKWVEPAVGEYTHYFYSMVSMTSYAGVMYATSEPRQPEVVHYTDDDDYGRKLDIDIQACTRFMEKTICGEKYQTEISTKGKLPKPLRSLTCETTAPGSITVKWLPPFTKYGEYTNIEVHAVPLVDALVSWLNNRSSESLDRVQPVKSLNVSGTTKTVTLRGLPKGQLYTIFVYAVNNAGRGELPGSMDRRDFAESFYYQEISNFEEKFELYLLHLTKSFLTYAQRLLPPVCSSFPPESLDPTMRKPSRLKVYKIGKDALSMTWRPPKRGGFLAGYRAKIKDKKGTCLWQYDFKCTEGCLSELFQHTEFELLPDEMKEEAFFMDFPELDNSCGNHTTVEMSRDQINQPITYNITGLPQTKRFDVTLTSIGYMQTGKSVTKKAKKQKKLKKQCAACSDDRNLQKVEELACNSNAVFYFNRGKLVTAKEYSELELKGGTSKFLYRDRRMRPRKYDIVMPGSVSKNCSCDLLKKAPRFKVAFLQRHSSSLYYVVDFIVSLEIEEIEAFDEKYEKTCWKK